MFSGGEDKQVLCWDLEANKVVRNYYGSNNGIYCVKLHPNLDIVVTGARDGCARVWDMRTRKQIYVLAGHTTVTDVLVQANDPQVVC